MGFGMSHGHKTTHSLTYKEKHLKPRMPFFLMHLFRDQFLPMHGLFYQGKHFFLNLPVVVDEFK